MAPKKKRKPAANPARGFATTSLPSKAKVLEAKEHVADESEASETGPDRNPAVASYAGIAASKNGEHSGQAGDISKMSAEELEAHLENSELEAMVDKHAARCLADARRQVARLENERRQLRLQAYKLSTYSWLPDDTIDELFAMASGFIEAAPSAVNANMASIDGDKLSLDLWTLERVLLSLKLPRVHEAIAYIAQTALLGRLKENSGSLLGLTEALQWYATNASADELMPYEQIPGTKANRSGDSTPLQISGE